MDVQGNYSDPVIREVLANVKAKTDTFKILGVYKEITAC
jgi:prephenate dehydratase